MTAPAWVDLSPLVDPVKDGLATAIGKTVKYAEAPAAGVPPFTVLQIISDPRQILTLDGGIPVDVTWQCDHIAATPLQALAMGDKAWRWMVFGTLPTFPAATVTYREGTGDPRQDKIGDGRWLWQQRFRWTFIAAA